MWDPAPVLLCTVGELSFWAVYITYGNGCYPVDTHLARMSVNDVIFLLLTWHRIGFYKQRLEAYSALPCKVVLCANTPEEHQELLNAGCDAIYCNHNAWLDHSNLFVMKNAPRDQAHLKIKPSMQEQQQGQQQQQEQEKQQKQHQNPRLSHLPDQLAEDQQQQQEPRSWQLVVNANSSPYKRVHLAAAVSSRVHISYDTGVQHDSCGSENGSCAADTTAVSGGSDGSDGSADSNVSAFSDGRPEGSRGSQGFCINQQPDGSFRYMSSQEVVAVLHQCSVGGIFSAEEGTCYACTEYLLCGLPVITTASLGGRHVWLNERNSITVEPTVDAVGQAVDLALRKLECGEFDRASIRQEAVQLAECFRAGLVQKVVQICRQRGGGAGRGNSSSAVDAGKLLQELGSRHKLGLV